MAFYGSIIVVGAAAEWDRFTFEKRASPETGHIVGRYIISCAERPCTFYPAGYRLTVQPDLAASRAFDAANCINRNGFGGRRTRGSTDQGPCRHVIVTAYYSGDRLLVDHEATTPRFYWDQWKAASLSLLVDDANPTDARIDKNPFDLHYWYLALVTIAAIAFMIAFEWIKARTWDPWRKRTKRNRRARQRRKQVKLAKTEKSEASLP